MYTVYTHLFFEEEMCVHSVSLLRRRDTQCMCVSSSKKRHTYTRKGLILCRIAVIIPKGMAIFLLLFLKETQCFNREIRAPFWLKKGPISSHSQGQSTGKTLTGGEHVFHHTSEIFLRALRNIS